MNNLLRVNNNEKINILKYYLKLNYYQKNEFLFILKKKNINLYNFLQNYSTYVNNKNKEIKNLNNNVKINNNKKIDNSTKKYIFINKFKERYDFLKKTINNNSNNLSKNNEVNNAKLNNISKNNEVNNTKLNNSILINENNLKLENEIINKKNNIQDDNIKIKISKKKNIDNYNKNNQVKVVNKLIKNENLKKNYNKNFLKIKNISELVSNKRVIIVGPANYLSNIKNKDFIESFDIVIRINRSIPIPIKLEEYIGKRTDILVSNLNLVEDGDDIPIQQNILENAGVKLIYCPYPKIFPFLNDQKKYLNGNYNNFNVEWIDSLFYNHLEHILNTRPNSGTITILTLLRNNVKELFVTGFSFYNDGYIKGYKNKKLRSFKKNLVIRHNQDSQINLIKEIYLKNNLLKIDSTMVGIIFKDLIYFINKYFTKIDELYFKLNYKFSIPKFIKKYNREKSNNILFLFSNENFSQIIDNDIFNIVIHKNKYFKDTPKSVYVCNENININLFNNLINTRNKGNIYLQKINVQYLKIIDEYNLKFILNHNYMLNGNIFINFANIIANTFNISNYNYDMLFILFSLIFDIEKKATIYLCNKDLELNNLLELKNFLGKNLFVKFI